MKIPAHTLYVVLCYAWKRYEHLESAAEREHASAPDDLPQNLLARLLRDSFRRLWRRGLDRGYLERGEDARRPKGKIDMAGTVGRALRSRARVAVHYEELTRNVLPNRLVKSTMLRLASLPVNALDDELRRDLMRLARLLPEVAEVELRREFFQGVQLHRNNSDYGFLLSVCRLVAARLVLEGRSGRYWFRTFTASDTEMGHLFEAFVRGFLQREYRALGVHPGHKEISWGADVPHGAPGVPKMQADIFVPARSALNRRRSVIVETKCVDHLFGRGGKLRSDHLYQLWAYLTNYSRANAADRAPAGLLLYATNGLSFRHVYSFPGHPLEVRSIDLGQPWPGLRRDLRDLADDLARVTGAIASAA